MEMKSAHAAKSSFLAESPSVRPRQRSSRSKETHGDGYTLLHTFGVRLLHLSLWTNSLASHDSREGSRRTHGGS